MTSLTYFNTAKRLPLPLLISAVLHGSVIAALLYASFQQKANVPKASEPITASLVAPQVQPQPAPAAVNPPEPQPEPESEPETVPEPPKPEPVPIPKPEPKPKPKPKPVKKVEPEPEREVKPRVQPREASPFNEDRPASQDKPQTAPKPSQAKTQSSTNGPRALSVTKPGYPERARALRIEGRVRVQFDVDDEGRVQNIRILSAEPRNMFEREVRQSMRKWRYQSGNPGQNLTMRIVFRFKGGSSIE